MNVLKIELFNWFFNWVLTLCVCVSVVVIIWCKRLLFNGNVNKGMMLQCIAMMLIAAL